MRQKFSMARRLAAAAVAIVILGGAAAAGSDVQLADRAPDRYTVQKGDTLWGIASKFLRDPWRWPDIWRLNRDEIKNPHRIYPGDVIVLDRNAPGVAGATGPRLRLDDRATVRLQPSIRSTPLDRDVIPSIPASDIEPYLTEPLVTGPEGLASAAEIIAGRDQRVVRSASDLVYATGIDPHAGDLWYVYRPGPRLVSLRTKEILGYEQQFLGTARVERFGDVSSVRIASAKEEILIGDRLIPAPREPVIAYVPHPPAQPINGQIIGSATEFAELGRGSVVTIDKGARDGVDVGTVLAIYHVVPPIRDPRPSKEPDIIRQVLDQTTSYREDRFLDVPDERTGLMFVFRVFDRVAYALVVNTTDPVNVGDWIRQP